jgi:hypothetical protein
VPIVPHATTSINGVIKPLAPDPERALSRHHVRNWWALRGLNPRLIPCEVEWRERCGQILVGGASRPGSFQVTQVQSLGHVLGHALRRVLGRFALHLPGAPGASGHVARALNPLGLRALEPAGMRPTGA